MDFMQEGGGKRKREREKDIMGEHGVQCTRWRMLAVKLGGVEDT
jgi:hypothetical protein